MEYNTAECNGNLFTLFTINSTAVSRSIESGLLTIIPFAGAPSYRQITATRYRNPQHTDNDVVGNYNPGHVGWALCMAVVAYMFTILEGGVFEEEHDAFSRNPFELIIWIIEKSGGEVAKLLRSE